MNLSLRQYNYRSPTGRTWSLYLPVTAGHARVQQQAEKQGAGATTSHGVLGRRVDQPVHGTVAVFQRDEREARRGKPIALYSHVEGRPPLLLMGMGEEHLEALTEKAQEMRHYGEDAVQRQNDRPDMQALWNRNVERAKRKAEGRITYGRATKGRL